MNQISFSVRWFLPDYGLNSGGLDIPVPLKFSFSVFYAKKVSIRHPLNVAPAIDSL